MTIVLIGPRGVGKTSVAKLIVEKLCLSYVSLDEEGKNLDFPFRQSPQGRAHIVRKVFEKYQKDKCLFDFGAFHSYYIEEDLSNEIYELLLPEPNVFLLTPSEDIQESEKILYEMNSKQVSEPFLSGISRTNSNLIRSSQNESLAKHIVYTKDLSFEQIADLVTTKVK
ncbi:AAA family ATPase [Peribacillus sp. SCS-37]|uniref:AAA family ATPase n=1 Tax=Paraperibacillus esterisolvens TaxID=3115296 RepID=UPI0039065D3E